ncbi:hypothetical protein BDY19DRAFT_909823 [Irpex rosettiformis]|uniref:Uncharacterized protein n=1 Tax=Irpex rosettiformis TaxID=378272 RepID=A0ACB8TR48_9APHY|nr:hypothetical protein BDY19DRAFT_909823 [Irpex rosettiformis]
MSSISEIKQEIAANYITVSASVLFIFELCITLSQEFDVIWCHKWTITTWVYAFNRYSIFLLSIFTFVPTWNFESCTTSIRITDVLTVSQFLCAAIFSTLRVYALLDGKLLVAGIVFSLSIVPLGTDIFKYATDVPAWLGDIGGCTATSTKSEGLNISLSLITRMALVVADALVMIVTWFKTYQLYIEARRLKMPAPLSWLLFRDGMFYFLVLQIVNILEVLSVNIVKPPGSSWNSGGQSGSLRFAGNMGEPLQFGVDQENGDQNESIIPAEELHASAIAETEAEEGQANHSGVEV